MSSDSDTEQNLEKFKIKNRFKQDPEEPKKRERDMKKTDKEHNVTNGGTVVSGTVFLIWWFAGLAIAKGFWLTLLSIVFPPYPMYLLIELLVNKFLL